MKTQINRLIIGMVAVMLVSCAETGIVRKTRCQTAIADATQTWEVQYYISKVSGGLNDSRFLPFQSNTLTNVNGEKPSGAASGPDDNGVWWAALPPRPTADEVDQYRQSGEFQDPPLLQRSVKYQLRCENGTLLTDAQTYREASRAFRAGQAVQVSYWFDRALKIESPQEP